MGSSIRLSVANRLSEVRTSVLASAVAQGATASRVVLVTWMAMMPVPACPVLTIEIDASRRFAGSVAWAWFWNFAESRA